MNRFSRQFAPSCTDTAPASASSFCAHKIHTVAMALCAMALILSSRLLRLIRIILPVVIGKSEYTVLRLQAA